MIRFSRRFFFIGAILIFCMSSYVLYTLIPSDALHFEGDSLHYEFIATHWSLLKTLPLEVLGYPFFIFIVYFVFHHISALVIAQMMLSILSLYFLRRISFLLGGTTAEIVVTLLWLFNLGFLIYSQLVLIEVILTLFYLWFIERVIIYYYLPQNKYLVQAGLILGVSILLRPAALFYALFFAVFLLFLQAHNVWVRLCRSFIFLLFFYVPIILYMFLNYWWFGYFTICPVMNVNLFRFFYPKLVAVIGWGLPNELVSSLENDIAQNSITFKTQLNLVKIIFNYPWISLKIWLMNAIKTMFGPYTTHLKLLLGYSKSAYFFNLTGNILEKFGAYIMSGTDCKWIHIIGWFECCYLLIEYMSAFVGSIWLLLRREWWIFLFALSFVAYFVMITGPDGSGRFRMMIEPWLMILTALGITWIINRKKVIT